MTQKEICELISQMTLDEKIKMIHGEGFFNTGAVERLSIPSLKMSDGPMGVRHEIKPKVWEDKYETEDFVSYFPSNVAIAATWNKDRAYESGCGLGAEARGRGKDVILAPGINIMRTPLCGRNFEYMSEDPCLISNMVVPLIKGIQENDVAACVKHFAMNNQEEQRMEVDVYTDERSLREIYLRGFESAVKKAGTYSIMSAYNKFRGEHCSHSKYLLDKILRDEWNFDGAVISDWDAVHDTKKAVECGLDIEMGTNSDFDNYNMANPLIEKIKNGEIKESLIDKKIEHIIKFMDKIGMFKEDRKIGTYNSNVHRENILKTAEESVVLLKNEGVLPLQRKKLGKVAVIGDNAQKLHASGGGSAEIKALYEISPILGLKMVLGGDVSVEYERGYSQDTEKSEILKQSALELAKNSDTVIYIGGLNHDYDSEGLDRKDMKLPYNQDELISELLEVNPNTIIVMVSGSPVEMYKWIDKAKAVVQSWYAGMEGGFALAEVLLGKVNPSGKLPVTFPLKLGDSPAHCLGEYPGSDKKVHYNEGIYTGYRYYDKNSVKPLFCFGHGLSYTNFEYNSIDSQFVEVDNKKYVRVKVSVKNIGDRDGYETVQIYMSGNCGNMDMPVKELKGFEKVFLKASEEKEVVIDIDVDDCMSYSEEKESFEYWNDEVKIMAGSSSCDIKRECVLCFALKKMN